MLAWIRVCKDAEYPIDGSATKVFLCDSDPAVFFAVELGIVYDGVARSPNVCGGDGVYPLFPSVGVIGHLAVARVVARVVLVQADYGQVLPKPHPHAHLHAKGLGSLRAQDGVVSLRKLPVEVDVSDIVFKDGELALDGDVGADHQVSLARSVNRRGRNVRWHRQKVHHGLCIGETEIALFISKL